MVLLQMSSRQAKVARVVAVDTPDNSSSESEEDEEQEGGQDIQVVRSDQYCCLLTCTFPASCLV